MLTHENDWKRYSPKLKKILISKGRLSQAKSVQKQRPSSQVHPIRVYEGFSSGFLYCSPLRQAQYNEIQIEQLKLIKKRRPKGAAKNAKIITPQFMIAGFSPLIPSNRASLLASPGGRHSPEKRRVLSEVPSRIHMLQSGGPSPQNRLRYQSTQFRSILIKKHSVGRHRAHNSLVNGLNNLIHSEEPDDNLEGSLRVSLTALKDKSKAYQSAINDYLLCKNQSQIDNQEEARLRDNTMQKARKEEQKTIIQIRKAHERNWIFLRRIGAKPKIWKCPKYKFPKDLFDKTWSSKS